MGAQPSLPLPQPPVPPAPAMLGSQAPLLHTPTDGNVSWACIRFKWVLVTASHSFEYKETAQSFGAAKQLRLCRVSQEDSSRLVFLSDTFRVCSLCLCYRKEVADRRGQKLVMWAQGPGQEDQHPLTIRLLGLFLLVSAEGAAFQKHLMPSSQLPSKGPVGSPLLIFD